MLRRRLYFLLPDTDHARTTADELRAGGIARADIHAVARPDIDLGVLPEVTGALRRDRQDRAEHWLWGVNLGMFFVALVVMVLALAIGAEILVLAMAGVILASVGLGIVWSQLPDVDLGEFRDGLSHGEVLLMVDVPWRDGRQLIEEVRRHHPEALPGGSTWIAV
jgi:hypothetical protein